MIEVKGLYKIIRRQKRYCIISTPLSKNGKTSLIIGQSGSGKTVLMKM